MPLITLNWMVVMVCTATDSCVIIEMVRSLARSVTYESDFQINEHHTETLLALDTIEVVLQPWFASCDMRISGKRAFSSL